VKEIAVAIFVVLVVVSFLPVVVLLWKMAIDELFGSSMRREFDRLIDNRIAEIEKLAEDCK
jgi:hypothetical protein